MIVTLTWGLVLTIVILLRLPSNWALFAGLLLGMALVSWWLLPQTLMPGWISNWQHGAWGEQATAKELRGLPSCWTVRHDVRSIGSTNRDHVVASRSVFLLDTKSLSDSIVTVENGGLRVQAIEDSEKSYLLDRFPVGIRCRYQKSTSIILKQWAPSPTRCWLRSRECSSNSRVRYVNFD